MAGLVRQSLEIDGEARAYPMQILMYHEIVNDMLAGVPVSFEDFLTAYPDGEVLSKETDFLRPYDNINANPFLFDRKVDPRLRGWRLIRRHRCMVNRT